MPAGEEFGVLAIIQPLHQDLRNESILLGVILELGHGGINSGSSRNGAATSGGKKAMLQRCNAEAAREWVSSLTSEDLVTQFGSMMLYYTQRWINSLVWFSRLDFVILYCLNET